MNSLSARLSLALLLIVATIGAGFYLVDSWSTRQYYQELTQRLNASIAMYVTGQTTLIDDGSVNKAELERLAERAMVINPSVEVYLLDRQGRVLAHGMPPESVLLEQVDLGPVQRLISGGDKMPIRGTDPRAPGSEKVFSAAEVVDDDGLEGYLYVVLGGQQYDELAESIRGTYVRQVSVGATLALVAAGSLAGLLLFTLLTRRLKRLTVAVQQFTDSGFDPEADPTLAAAPADGSGDEIGRLDGAFRSMAAKIGEQFESLQETDRLRRELISNVSHDLRTPLATMHGYIDTLLLKNEELSVAERARYLEIARKHTQRLGSLIEDLFELSKFDSGSMQPELESFPLAELLHDVVQDFELDGERRDIRIEMAEIEGSTVVHADIALIQRVLENLVRNALENTPAGGRITVAIESVADGVAVSVEDTGRGIPEEALDSIFDRFYCAHDSAIGETSSTGLGLAIVKRILDLHGSRVRVESRVDEGTRFEFSLSGMRAA